MKKKNQFEYTRVLKLPPAIGDWTTIQFHEQAEDVSISPVVNINFDSFPKDELRKAHMLHYHFADRLAHKLSKDMNLKVELHTVSASQMSYGDFLNSQEDKVVQSDFVVQNLGRVNVIMEWGLSDMIVDRLTGGKGEETNPNNFSEIELHVLHDHVHDIVPHFSFAWGSIFRPEDVAMEFVTGRYKRDRKMTLREAYVIFTSYIHFGKGTVKKVICAYPNVVLRRLMNLHARTQLGVKQNVMLNPKTMHGMNLDVVATLGKATLTMAELRELAVGDVIPLDTALNAPVEITIGDDAQLYAQPGITNDHISAQVIFWDGVSDPGGLIQQDMGYAGSPLAQAPLVEQVEPSFEPSYEPEPVQYAPEPAPVSTPEPVQEEQSYEPLDMQDEQAVYNEPVDSQPQNEVEPMGASQGFDDDFEDDFDDDFDDFDDDTEVAAPAPPAPEPEPAPVAELDDGFDDDDYDWDDLEDDF